MAKQKVVPYKTSQGDFGGVDLVTALRQQEVNNFARHGALKEGHRRLNTIENYTWGTMDWKAHTSGLGVDYDYGSHFAIESSYKGDNELRKNLADKLNREYRVIEEAADILKERAFVYDPQTETFTLDVPGTIMCCKVSPDDEMLAVYEAVIEAEKEYENNAQVLRDLVVRPFDSLPKEIREVREILIARAEEQTGKKIPKPTPVVTYLFWRVPVVRE